jgi:hypothetical protein
VGLEVRDALVQQKMATADVVMLAYAESLGLPYVELEDVGVDEQLVPQISPTMARQHSCVPVMADEGQLLMASPNLLLPDVEEELRLRFNMPVRTVLCTPASLNAVIAEHYPRDAAEPAAPTAKKAKQPATKKAAPKPQSEPLSQEEKARRQKLFVVIAFNVTVIMVIVLCAIIHGGMAFLGFMDFVMAILLASIAAAAAFGMSMRLNK